MTVPHASRRKGNFVPSRWTVEHDKILLVMVAADHTDADIAAVIGFSEKYVNKHRNALGVHRPTNSKHREFWT